MQNRSICMCISWFSANIYFVVDTQHYRKSNSNFTTISVHTAKGTWYFHLLDMCAMVFILCNFSCAANSHKLPLYSQYHLFSRDSTHLTYDFFFAVQIHSLRKTIKYLSRSVARYRVHLYTAQLSGSGDEMPNIVSMWQNTGKKVILQSIEEDTTTSKTFYIERYVLSRILNTFLDIIINLFHFIYINLVFLQSVQYMQGHTY